MSTAEWTEAPGSEWQPLAPVGVEADIRRLCGLLEELTADLAQAARTAALADAAYKREHAKSLLGARGIEKSTVGEREAVADLECADEYEARRISEAVLMAKQESGRNIRAQLDALRSINANLRAVT